MSVCNREIMISRTCVGDETGLLVTIPFPVFYKFSNSMNNLVDMEISLTDYKKNIQGVLYFKILDKTFTIADASGNLIGTDADFMVVSDGKDNNKPYVFDIHVKIDKNTQSVKIYDGFYYLYTSTECEAFNGYKYNFIPCCLFGIQCGYLDKLLDSPPEISNPYTQLIIDRFTGVITGVVAKDDILFTRHNQIVVKNNLICSEIKELNNSLINLILRYKYENGKIVPVDINDTRIKTVEDCKKKIENIRNLQIKSSKWVIDDLLYNKFYSVKKVQRYIKKIKKQVSIIEKEIEEILYKISEKKHFNYFKNRNIYLCHHNFRYYVSICLLIKDENSYLKEWLEHYDSIGVEHFYIFDNGSKIPVKNTIEPIDNGKFINKCTIIPFSNYKKNMQYECYEKCLSDYGEESRWIGFFDTDEFVDIGNKNICDFLQSYENNFCVWFPWEQYNANGHIVKSEKKMSEYFTQRVLDPFGLWGKVFLQPHLTAYMYVHLGYPLDDYERVINVDYNDHLNNYSKMYNISRTRFLDDIYKYGKIRHYFTRSFEEWIEKINRGSSDPNFRRKLNEFFIYNPELEFLKEDQKVQKMLDTKQGYT